MKKLFLNLLAIVTILILSSAIAYSAGDLYNVPFLAGQRVATVTGYTVTSANIDTFRVPISANIASLAIGIYVQDSSLTDLVYARRGFAVGTNTYYSIGIASTDTISTFTAWSNKADEANPVGYRTGTVTLAPQGNVMDIVIDWGTGCGTTASKPATISFIRTFYK